MNARAANSVYHSLNAMLKPRVLSTEDIAREPQRQFRFIQNGTRMIGGRPQYSVLDTETLREHHFNDREIVDRLTEGQSDVDLADLYEDQ